MINLFLILLALFFFAMVYVAVMEVVHKVRVQRRTRELTNEWGNFEPLSSDKECDPTKPPPFHIGGSAGERPNDRP